MCFCHRVKLKDLNLRGGVAVLFGLLVGKKLQQPPHLIFEIKES